MSTGQPTVVMHYPRVSRSVDGIDRSVVQLRWIVARLRRALGGAPVICIVHAGGEPPALRPLAEASEVVLYHSPAEDTLGAITLFMAESNRQSVCFIREEAALLPDGLINLLVGRHDAGDSWFSSVAGLPSGLTPIVLDRRILPLLPAPALSRLTPQALSELVMTMVKQSEAVTGDSGPRITSLLIDARQSCALGPGDIPEIVSWAYPDGKELLDTLIGSDPDASLPATVLLRTIKSASIDRRRRRRSQILPAATPPRPQSPRRILLVANPSAYSGAHEAAVRRLQFAEPQRFSYGSLLALPGEFARRLEASGCTVRCLGQDFSLSSFDVLADCVRILQEERPDLVHVIVESGLPFLMAATSLGIPIVCQACDFRVNPEALAFASKVIAVSDFIRKGLLTCDISPDDVAVIHDGVDSQHLTASPALRFEVRRRLQLDPNCLCIVMIARFVPYKRHDLVLRAFAEVARNQPSRLVLIGEPTTEGGVFERARSLISQLGISTSVSLVGFQPDVKRILAGADILVSAASGEPLGLSVLEAMSMQVPVVVSDNGGTRELISDGREGLLFADGNANDLADKLRILYADPTLRRDMGRRGRISCLKNFQARRSMELTERVYSSLLERRPGYAEISSLPEFAPHGPRR